MEKFNIENELLHLGFEPVPDQGDLLKKYRKGSGDLQLEAYLDFNADKFYIHRGHDRAIAYESLIPKTKLVFDEILVLRNTDFPSL